MKPNPLTPPGDFPTSLALAAGLLTAGAVVGSIAGNSRTGIAAAMAAGLIGGVFYPKWREVAFATSAFGAGALLISDISK